MQAQPLYVALDCNALVCLTGPDCDDKVKLEHLLQQLDRRKGKAIIPTPAIAEYLVYADAGGLNFIEAIQKRASVQVADFNLAAAFEAANMDAAAIGRGDKRDGSGDNWQKVKYDRQIVAIAKANGAKLIVSNDAGIRANAARVGLKAASLDELDLPDSARQHKLPIANENAAAESLTPSQPDR